MKKTIVWIVGILLVIGLLAAAFGGGLLVGRAANILNPRSVEVTVEPVLSDSGEMDEDEVAEPTAEPDPDEVLPPVEEAPPVNPEESELDFAMLRQVLDILEQEYYGELPDAATLSYGAIRGMLFTLDDPYTTFIEPDIAAIWNQDATGEFEGIGATVQMREDGYLEIVRPLPDHPAEAAGLRAGDLILTVNDESITGMGLYEAIGLIRGPAGSTVELEIARPGERDTFFVEVIRARIELPNVEYRMLDNDIAYIRLTEFDETATERVEAALEELLAQGAWGLVFDLRDNPGGYLQQAILVGDLFLGEGIVAIERDSDGNERQFSSYDGQIGEDIPMVVLVNGGSASASEIVAGAIQDRDRAVLIGEPTLGKGSVQLPHNLSDGSQLRVTIARWFTPDNHSIHGEGLTPEIETPYLPETPVDEDPQLDRALEYLIQGE
ncbi:MAG: S41 family peptidase [Anaerolineae bacterium]|nr:S41 family peptidase [Anaerolineae bacterium]